MNGEGVQLGCTPYFQMNSERLIIRCTEGLLCSQLGAEASLGQAECKFAAQTYDDQDEQGSQIWQQFHQIWRQVSDILDAD